MPCCFISPKYIVQRCGIYNSGTLRIRTLYRQGFWLAKVKHTNANTGCFSKMDSNEYASKNHTRCSRVNRLAHTTVNTMMQLYYYTYASPRTIGSTVLVPVIPCNDADKGTTATASSATTTAAATAATAATGSTRAATGSAATGPTAPTATSANACPVALGTRWPPSLKA